MVQWHSAVEKPMAVEACGREQVSPWSVESSLDQEGIGKKQWCSSLVAPGGEQEALGLCLGCWQGCLHS